MTVENKVGTIDKQTANTIGVTAYLYSILSSQWI
jgi:hypothetical protein